MEPFPRLVVAQDKVPMTSAPLGFVMIGPSVSSSASARRWRTDLPSILHHFGIAGNAPNGVPLAVQYSFKLGAVVFLLAVLWTVFTVKEKPPENMAEFLRAKRATPRKFSSGQNFF